MNAHLLPTAYQTPQGYKGLDCYVTKDLDIDTGRACATGIFAAASRDRGGDILEIAGIKTEAHRANPIALWLHGYDRQPDINMPIGVNEDPDGNYTVKLLPDQGIAVNTVYFTQKTLLGSQICALVMERTIRAQSIGYRELRVDRIMENDRYVGSHLLETELLETSFVPLPMNADAVRAVLSKKVCGKSLCPSIKSALAPYASPAPVWANGFTLGKTMRRKSKAEPEEAHGPQALRAMHNTYKSGKGMLERWLPLTENATVKELLQVHLEALDELHEAVKTTFEEEYGAADLPPLEREDADASEDEDDEEEKADDEDEDEEGDEDELTEEQERKALRELDVAKHKLLHHLRLLNQQERRAAGEIR